MGSWGLYEVVDVKLLELCDTYKYLNVCFDGDDDDDDDNHYFYHFGIWTPAKYIWGFQNYPTHFRADSQTYVSESKIYLSINKIKINTKVGV